MIRELINEARQLDLRAGECFEVHVGPTSEVGWSSRLPVTDVIRTWKRESGVHEICEGLSHGRTIDHRWLAVVHEDGVVLAPLDVAEWRALPF